MCLSPWAKGFGRGYETAFSSAIASRKAPENSAGYQFFSGLCDHRSLLNSLTGALYSLPTAAREASLPRVSPSVYRRTDFAYRFRMRVFSANGRPTSGLGSTLPATPQSGRCSENHPEVNTQMKKLLLAPLFLRLILKTNTREQIVSFQNGKG